MSAQHSAFVPDSSWPSIVELAIKAWGDPTGGNRTTGEVRFGAKGSKVVDTRANRWFDHEANAGGGYVDIWPLAYPGELLPPRTDTTAKPTAKPKRNGPQLTGEGPKPWDDVGPQRYPYSGADGALILEVFRTISGNPRFRQRCPNGTLRDGSIKWKWSVRHLPNHNRLLYRLPELIASGNATVWITEGEKDADNLVRLGLIATTNIGGAGKWRDEYAAAFADKPVVILQDNDQAGRDHTAAVARSLIGVASSVKVLLPPGLPEKGDVSDWLKAGGTLDELIQIAKETPKWVPPVGPVLQDPPNPEEGEGEREETDGEDGPGREWIADPDGKTEPPPRQSEDEEFVLPIEFSESYLSYLFSDRHKEHLVYVHGWGNWRHYHVGRWHEDHTIRVYDAARAICAEQGERALHTLPARYASKIAAIINKASCIAAIERLARHHEPQTRHVDLFDADQSVVGTPSRPSKIHRNRKE